MCTGARPAMSTASSRARSRRTCRAQAQTKYELRPRSRTAPKFLTGCSRSPTRRSNEKAGEGGRHEISPSQILTSGSGCHRAAQRLGTAAEHCEARPTRIGGNKSGVARASSAVAVTAQNDPFDELAGHWIRDGRASRLSAPRPLTSSEAALGRTATSRASTPAFAMSCSTGRSSTLCARPRSTR